MLDFEDNRWNDMQGGYRVAYDPRPALARLEEGRDIEAAWKELWNELHHQGDVGEASYAAVPHLLRIYESGEEAHWNTLALVGLIELLRGKGRNPDVPPFLQDSYQAAWKKVPVLAIRDLELARDKATLQTALGTLALARGLPGAGHVLLMYTEDELHEIIERHSI